MSRNYLFFLSIPVLVSLGGCHKAVEIEPASFSHKDEMIREGDFIILADRRIFATMAFLNAVGYDDDTDEIPGEVHPVLLRVREILEAKDAAHPGKFRKWRIYYEQDKWPDHCYKDFVLSLSTDYPFKRIRSDIEWGYPFVAARLKDFPTILNDFWATVGLDEIWNQVKPGYLEEMRKYDFAKMKRQLAFVWEYLRMDRDDDFVFVSIPSLLDPHSAMGANYENYWYMVESLQSSSHDFHVHEYLHSIINSMVEACYETHKEKLDTYLEARIGTIFAKSYRTTDTYTYECLVRALTYRISILLEKDPSIIKHYEGRVRYLTDNGLSLVGPFYELLPEFEQSDKSFEEFLPKMLEMLPQYSK